MTDDPGRVRERHPLVGQRAAGAAQQHPRPGQGRVGHRHRRAWPTSRSTSCAATLLREFEPVARGKGLGYSIDLAPGLPRHASSPTRSASARSSRTCSPTRSSSPRRGDGAACTIGLADDGWSREIESLGRAPSVVAFSVTRHRHRHRRRAAAADLRGVRPGRRHDRPPLRRHRPRPLDQPRAGRPARRRDHRRRARPARAARSPSTCPRRPDRDRVHAPAAGCRRRRDPLALDGPPLGSPAIARSPASRRSRRPNGSLDGVARRT